MADPVAAGLPPSRRRRTAEQLEADQSSLIELRSKLPFISQSALSQILKIAAREPLPTLSSAQAIRKCRDTRVATLTPYGAIHQTKVHAISGKTFEFQHPFAMLYYVCKVSAVMSKLVSQLPPSSPDAPLSMIFYTDEISPGNQLSYKNKRKTWGLYWSIFELGAAALSCEDIHMHCRPQQSCI